MLRSFLVGALALVLTAGPGFAQERQPPAAAVYSSDGQRLGEIKQVGMSGTQPGFLDVAQSAVVIPINMIVQKPDRIELSMTAAEVKDTLNKQKP